MRTRTTTVTTSNPTSPAGLPSTGNKFLDKELDRLDPVAMLAIVALLERHGQDDASDLAHKRLEAKVAWMQDPDAVEAYARAKDTSVVEELVAFWQAYRAGWQAQN